MQAAERTPGSDSCVRTLAADMTRDAEIVVRRFVDKSRNAKLAGRPPDQKISAERNLTVAGKFGKQCGGLRVSFHLIGFIVVVRAIFSFLGSKHPARRGLTRLGLRAPVCHPEVDVFSPTTPGFGSTHTRIVNIRRLHRICRSGDDVRPSKLVMADRLPMDYCLAGALARALADGSHI
ncbi:hypothetical protein MES4922_120142 [Mesorhizobium ventifaucium]|uniref:Transposase DDE domain-containing protein n=1 Tax=Mesorhizobium ventifaucium TaxID=666020 RepID=A0ABM9DFP3_9HYPH|nr:hypothetical protein MES4922_120142 [Mesorhizobium ventifaucium]